MTLKASSAKRSAILLVFTALRQKRAQDNINHQVELHHPGAQRHRQHHLAKLFYLGGQPGHEKPGAETGFFQAPEHPHQLGNPRQRYRPGERVTGHKLAVVEQPDRSNQRQVHQDRRRRAGREPAQPVQNPAQQGDDRD